MVAKPLSGAGGDALAKPLSGAGGDALAKPLSGAGNLCCRAGIVAAGKESLLPEVPLGRVPTGIVGIIRPAVRPSVSRPAVLPSIPAPVSRPAVLPSIR